MHTHHIPILDGSTLMIHWIRPKENSKNNETNPLTSLTSDRGTFSHLIQIASAPSHWHRRQEPLQCNESFFRRFTIGWSKYDEMKNENEGNE